jgi:hypothetical protein
VINCVIRVAYALFVVCGIMHISKVIDTTPHTETTKIVPKMKCDLSSEALVYFSKAIRSSTFFASSQYLTEKYACSKMKKKIKIPAIANSDFAYFSN